MDKTKWPIFQQDNASAHTSKVAQAYLDERSDIAVLSPWPSRSPDLSPIENAWAILERELNKKSIKSFDDFKSIIMKTWYECMTIPLCQRLIESMPKRLEGVHMNGGGSTKY